MSLASGSKILFVINSLGGGGAERVVCAVASKLADGQPDITVAIVTLDRDAEKYPLSPRIARHRLDSKGSFSQGFRGLYSLMRAYRPDVVVSFLTRSNVTALACARLLRLPCIISERVNLTSHFSADSRALVKNLAIRSLYNLADKVIAVSHGVSADLKHNYRISPRKIATIYNPVDFDAIVQAAHRPSSIPLPKDYFVSVGRLTRNKNFQLLLRAYSRARRASALVILGDGPERENLIALATELGIANNLYMPGFIDNPHSVVARAKAWVSPSNAEGFPNALVEAMCVGQAVVATDCDSGPSEILNGYPGAPRVTHVTPAPFGILVPPNNETAMSTALSLIEDPEVRRSFAVAAQVRSRDFDFDTTVSLYGAEIDAAIARSARCSAA